MPVLYFLRSKMYIKRIDTKLKNELFLFRGFSLIVLPHLNFIRILNL